MGSSGKHHHDPGRARFVRFRDQAQFDFDDMLIGDFLNGGRDPRDEAIDCVPVRFGGGLLANPLSDSAIAGALVDAGVFDDGYGDDTIELDGDLGCTLFDLVAEEASAKPASQPAARSANASPSESAAMTADDQPPCPQVPKVPPLKLMVTRRARPTAPAPRFRVRGFAQGFAMGALVAGAGWMVISLVL